MVILAFRPLEQSICIYNDLLNTLYRRGHAGLLHSLDYDVNIIKAHKVISFRGIFAPTDHTYKPLAEKSRDCKDSDCQSMATWDSSENRF